MYEYFPDNYGWSLSVMMSLGMGAEIVEVDEICQPLRAAASADLEVGGREWMRAWSARAEALAAVAADDESNGRKRSATQRWLRAAQYHQIAERQVGIKTDDTLAVYRKGLYAFARGVRTGDLPIEFVEVPYGDTSLPALFIPAADRANAPCVVHFDGLDVTKELIYLMHADALRDRHVSMLICDPPGIGEAVRFRGLHLSADMEKPAMACVDYLAARGDIPLDRTGMMALSAGGHYAPRAAAYEKRFRFCAAWGAIWDYHAVWAKRFDLMEEGSTPATSVPWRHLAWVLGTDTKDAALAKLKDFTLDGVAEHITCPLLILHGEDDRQIPVADAERTYAAATSAARRDLVVIPKGEPGSEHCQLDAASVGVSILHDWIDEVA